MGPVRRHAPHGAVRGPRTACVPRNVQKRAAMTAWARWSTSSRLYQGRDGAGSPRRPLREFGGSGGCRQMPVPCGRICLNGSVMRRRGRRAADDSAPSCSTANHRLLPWWCMLTIWFRRPERDVSSEHQAPAMFRSKENVYMRWRHDSAIASRTAEERLDQQSPGGLPPFVATRVGDGPCLTGHVVVVPQRSRSG